MHNTREKIIEEDVLIVEAHKFLDLLKGQIRIVYHGPVVETVE